MKRSECVFILFFFVAAGLFAQIQDLSRPPEGSRFWNGLNPYHQPSRTTNYYGSGDVNCDGVIDDADVSLLFLIVGQYEPGNVRADVDGNGIIDWNDITALFAALSGRSLSGWWNEPMTRQQRIDWVMKMIAIDTTKELNSYIGSSFECKDYARQMFINFAMERIDFGHYLMNRYNHGQTLFNIPMYQVSVGSDSAPPIGTNHAINAVFVGGEENDPGKDNPLVFENWLFIEPQEDSIVSPGDWNMNPDNPVIIFFQDYQMRDHATIVEFSCVNGQWIANYHDRDLMTTRPTAPTVIPDNSSDFWNPQLLKLGNGKVLYHTMNDDMDRNTAIHMSDLPFTDTVGGTALVDSSVCYMNRILDAMMGPDGHYHVLFTGKFLAPDDMYRVGLFHGTLDASASPAVIGDISQISSSTEYMSLADAKVLSTSGATYAFWTVVRNNQATVSLYWSTNSGSSWSTPELLSDLNTSGLAIGVNNWVVRNFDPYQFDVAMIGSTIHLVYVKNFYHGVLDSWLVHRKFVTSWSAEAYIPNQATAEINVRGCDIVKDKLGILHLVYWTGDVPTRDPNFPFVEGRGQIVHRKIINNSWTAKTVVDSTPDNCCPRLVADAESLNGTVYLVYDKKTGGQSQLAYATYSGTSWSMIGTLVSSTGETWYPDIEIMPGSPKHVTVIWSDRNPDRVTIKTHTIYMIQ
ncbi:MAG: dockerin type I repeat-containing protein [Spirochaetales bacterium]|nr:dockerin type I repeat-containing protein [Spirochaetales bacterium]